MSRLVVLMPLFRYLVVAGGSLLVLMFIADWVASTPTQERQQDRPQHPATAEIDRSIIRIHSANKWPAAVTLDTTTPIVVALPTVVANSDPAGQAGATSAPLLTGDVATAPLSPKIAERRGERPERIADASARRRAHHPLRMSAHSSGRDSRRRIAVSQDGFQGGDGWDWPRAGW